MLSMRISFSIFQMFILCTLSMCIRNWCVLWACTSGTDAYAEHTPQELMRALRIQVRNWCVHWASIRVRYQCVHRVQSLQNMLSIRIRNWCIPWAYGSGTVAFAEHMHQFLARMLSISVKIPNLKRSLPTMLINDHAHKELMRALSMHIRNWCVHCAYTSGTDA